MNINQLMELPFLNTKAHRKINLCSLPQKAPYSHATKLHTLYRSKNDRKMVFASFGSSNIRLVRRQQYPHYRKHRLCRSLSYACMQSTLNGSAAQLRQTIYCCFPRHYHSQKKNQRILRISAQHAHKCKWRLLELHFHSVRPGTGRDPLTHSPARRRISIPERTNTAWVERAASRRPRRFRPKVNNPQKRMQRKLPFLSCARPESIWSAAVERYFKFTRANTQGPNIYNMYSPALTFHARR
jgi:hypothetical protein